VTDPQHYTYRVTWSAEDGDHVGTCLELPSLSWLARTPAKALAGIQALVANTVADLEASGEPIPEAIAERRYSGQFNLRISPELHRQLSTSAAERGMSLNRYVSDQLART
jgi:predicted HicB family RNase H-like nuclease